MEVDVEAFASLILRYISDEDLRAKVFLNNQEALIERQSRFIQSINCMLSNCGRGFYHDAWTRDLAVFGEFNMRQLSLAAAALLMRGSTHQSLRALLGSVRAGY